MRNGSENGVKLLLRQRLYAPFLRYTSVVKTFNPYSGCSLCPTLFYLGYVLGPGSLSMVVFVRCPQLSQNRRYSGNAIDRFQKPRPPSESSWNLHILRKVWLIFKYALLEGLTVAVNKKFTFRLQTTIVLRSVPLLRNLPVLRLLSQQLSPSRVSGQVRRLLSPVTSKLQTRDKRQRIVKAFQ